MFKSVKISIGDIHVYYFIEIFAKIFRRNFSVQDWKKIWYFIKVLVFSVSQERGFNWNKFYKNGIGVYRSILTKKEGTNKNKRRNTNSHGYGGLNPDRDTKMVPQVDMLPPALRSFGDNGSICIVDIQRRKFLHF